jgi:hypothetical protein
MLNTPALSRRDFLKDTALLGAAVAAMHAVDGTAAEPAAAELPKLRLGNVEVTRLILGSNPFFGYAHQPGDIGRQMVEYYTDERIMEVMDQAAALGVTTVTAPPDSRWIKLYHKYLEKGGKIRTWLAQAHGDPRKMKEEISRAVKAGAKAVFIQGHRTEDTYAAGKFDQVRSWVEHIKSLGVPAGLAAHRADVHPAAEKAGFPTDFYFQCLYRPDTYLKEDRDRAVATIREINKPVIAYKILAAGRLPAQEAFEFAFRHIAAKDGVCVGVFPKNKPDMIAEDVGLARKLSLG